MRQIATLPDGNQAQSLADFLLTLHINTRLDHEAEGWALWVCDEDKVAQAHQELDAFLRAPTDPRYTVAHRTATVLRQEEDRQEEEYRQRQADLREKMTNPAHGGRRVTTALIFASILVAVVTQFGEKPEMNRYFTITNYDPKNLTTLTLPQQLATGEVWRLITPIFLHYGMIHLLFNMIWLATFGSQIELSRGPWKFLGLVLLIAVLSNLGQYYIGNISWQPGLRWTFNPDPRFGGMSGVVYGLFGYIWMKTRYDSEMGIYVDPSTVAILIGWFFLCMTPLIGHVANVAHAVGLLVGMAVGIAPLLWRVGR